MHQQVNNEHCNLNLCANGSLQIATTETICDDQKLLKHNHNTELLLTSTFLQYVPLLGAPQNCQVNPLYLQPTNHT